MGKPIPYGPACAGCHKIADTPRGKFPLASVDEETGAIDRVWCSKCAPAVQERIDEHPKCLECRHVHACQQVPDTCGYWKE